MGTTMMKKWMDHEEAIALVMQGLGCSRERAEEILDEYVNQNPEKVRIDVHRKH